MRTMRGFIPFAISFALLINIWAQHYRYFRRYALQDSYVRLLNSVLLFFVLFYVYPLKFLFVQALDRNGLDAGEARELFVIYGLGAAALQVVFCLMYLHVIAHRVALELKPLEFMRTRHTLIHHAATGSLALISVLAALVLPLSLMAIPGYIYFLLLPYFWISETIFDRRKRALKSH
jgi:uncharacterized membrane protein